MTSLPRAMTILLFISLCLFACRSSNSTESSNPPNMQGENDIVEAESEVETASKVRMWGIEYSFFDFGTSAAFEGYARIAAENISNRVSWLPKTCVRVYTQQGFKYWGRGEVDQARPGILPPRTRALIYSINVKVPDLELDISAVELIPIQGRFIDCSSESARSAAAIGTGVTFSAFDKNSNVKFPYDEPPTSNQLSADESLETVSIEFSKDGFFHGNISEFDKSRSTMSKPLVFAKFRAQNIYGYMSHFNKDPIWIANANQPNHKIAVIAMSNTGEAWYVPIEDSDVEPGTEAYNGLAFRVWPSYIAVVDWDQDGVLADIAIP